MARPSIVLFDPFMSSALGWLWYHAITGGVYPIVVRIRRPVRLHQESIVVQISFFLYGWTEDSDWASRHIWEPFLSQHLEPPMHLIARIYFPLNEKLPTFQNLDYEMEDVSKSMED